jgi:hypothetical protein
MAGKADEHTLLKAERLTKKKTLKVIPFLAFRILVLFQTLVG